MIDRIRTSRWKKLNAIDLTFGPGLNGIVGPNYTGKSSILWAIIYALGGSSALPSGYDLETAGTTGPFSVELWFMGKYYLYRGKNKVELFELGSPEPIAQGASVVNRRVSLILGMPVKRFIDLRMGRQKRIDNLLRMGGTELFRIVQELSGVDDLDKAISKVADRVKASEGALSYLPVVTREDVEQLRSNLATSQQRTAELEASLEGLEGTVAAVKAQVKNSEAAMQESKTQWSSYREKLSEYQDYLQESEARTKATVECKAKLQAKLELLGMTEQEAVEFLTTANAEKESLQEENARYRQLVSRKREMEEGLSKTSSTWAAYTSNLVKQQKLREELEGLKEVPKSEIHQDQAKCDSLLREISSLESRKKSIEEALSSSFCPTCKRAYDAEHDHQEALNAELSEVENKLLEVRPEWLRLCGHVQASRDGNQKFYGASRDLANVTSAIQAAEVARGELEEQLEKVDLEIAELSAIPEKLSKVREQAEVVGDRLEGYRQAVNKLKLAEARLEGLTEVTAPCEPVVEELSTLKAVHVIIEKQLQTAEREFNDTRNLLETSRVYSASLVADINTKQEQLESREELQKKSATENALLKYLRNSRDRFSRDTWVQFLTRASQFVITTTEGRVTDLDRDDKGNFRFCEGGNWMTVANASGAQENLIGLGIQMALADVSSCPLNVLLADEPTDSMEEEHSGAALMALASCGRQVIVVTHKELDRSLFETVHELGRAA